MPADNRSVAGALPAVTSITGQSGSSVVIRKKPTGVTVSEFLTVGSSLYQTARGQDGVVCGYHLGHDLQTYDIREDAMAAISKRQWLMVSDK